MADNTEVFNRLVEAEKYFKKTKFSETVKKAQRAYYDGLTEEANGFLDELPTTFNMLEALMKELKGKSVYKTLKKIIEGTVENNWESLKGLCSLCTHIAIECERGNTEYAMLLDEVMSKISEIRYNVND